MRKFLKSISVFVIITLIFSLLCTFTAAAEPILCYHSTFENNSTGWSVQYNGKISRTTSKSYEGAYSMKFTQRTASWDSPGYNLFPRFKTYGAGTYHISLRILVDKIDFATRHTRLVIRGNEENSFIRQYGNNYYYQLSTPVDLTENQWCYLSGTVSITEEDIVGTDKKFYLMFDVLNAVSGQNVYIDDFKVQKCTDGGAFDVFPSGRTLDIGMQQQLTVSQDFENITYISSNTNIATISSEGVVTAISPGKTRVEAYNNVTGQSDICFIVVNYPGSDCLIPNGTYFIKNRANRKYIQKDDNIITSEFQTNSDKWNFTYNSQFGYYKIISDSTGKALTLLDNLIYSVGNVEERTYNGSDNQHWYIFSTGDGYCKMGVKSEMEENEDFCIAVEEEFELDEGIKQYDYENLENCELGQWKIIYPSNTVQLEGQQRDLWCWIACSKMLTFEYMASPISQASAAVYVKSGIITDAPTASQKYNARSGGYLYEMDDAINYILGSTMLTYYAYKKIYSENVLRSILDIHPIIITRGVYDTEGIRIKAHAIILHSYYYDEEFGRWRYVIYDPEPMNRGEIKEISYDALCAGNEATISSETNIWVWDGIVVFRQGDYRNTIDVII